MTISFLNAPYKYEIEAVMKLFLPLESFAFLYENESFDDENYALIKASENSLSVEVSYNKTSVSKSQNSDRTHFEKNDDDELILCKMLFDIMSEITGNSPKWGFLTGIRPVKRVNLLLEKGFSEAEIIAHLKDRYYCSEEKIKLAYKTALLQKKCLSDIPDNSFSLYVSVPFCPSRCSYCSFVSHSIESSSAVKLLPQYVEKLCEEIALTAKIADDLKLELDTIYIGGGTPTSLSETQLEEVMSCIKNNFNILKIREYNVEAGRCDTISRKKLEIIKKYGATRISINPQTMSDSVLEKIGRKHSADDFLRTFNLAREVGFDNINTDTIAGLPSDTLAGFKNTIDTLVKLEPESITIHTLTVKRSSTLFSTENADEKAPKVSEMLDYGYKILDDFGYIPYYLYRQKNTVENLENVGFAKPSYECFYNINIMEESQTILAVGAGASTKLVLAKNGKISRVFNCKFPYEYVSRYENVTLKKQEIYNFFN